MSQVWTRRPTRNRHNGHFCWLLMVLPSLLRRQEWGATLQLQTSRNLHASWSLHRRKGTRWVTRSFLFILDHVHVLLVTLHTAFDMLAELSNEVNVMQLDPLTMTVLQLCFTCCMLGSCSISSPVKVWWATGSLSRDWSWWEWWWGQHTRWRTLAATSPKTRWISLVSFIFYLCCFCSKGQQKYL